MIVAFCAQIQKVISEGSNPDKVFSRLGWKDPNTTTSGPSLARQH